MVNIHGGKLLSTEKKNPSKLLTVAVLGGTGNEGAGLVLRWARAGYRVVIGSRSAERAAAKAEELNAVLGNEVIEGKDNVAAATKADIVVLSVPYGAHQATLDAPLD